MLVPPIGRELQTGRKNNHISRIFFMLATPNTYIGGRWLAAPMYGALKRQFKCWQHNAYSAGHCLFSRPLPIQSAVASRKGNIFNTRWRQN
jgi:hypothetical protein